MNPAGGKLLLDYSEFRKLASKYLGTMKDQSPLTKDDYVTMVRLWNTIVFQHLEGADPVFRDYSKLFFSGYLERASKELDAVVSKGMCFYSPKYDLYIGGKPHANSEFELRNKPQALAR